MRATPVKVTFEISEGGFSVTPIDDKLADQWLTDGPDFDFLEMKSIRCSLQWATECPAYDVDENCVPTGGPHPMGGYESGSHYISHGSRCDCNWWPILVPVLDPSGSTA